MELKPTAEDLARDLVADLAAAGQGGEVRRLSVAALALPAAVRRALAAEFEVARLRAVVGECLADFGWGIGMPRPDCCKSVEDRLLRAACQHPEQEKGAAE